MGVRWGGGGWVGGWTDVKKEPKAGVGVANHLSGKKNHLFACMWNLHRARLVLSHVSAEKNRPINCYRVTEFFFFFETRSLD